MASSKATTVAEYLAELPEARRQCLQHVREVILRNLGKGFEEGIQYGMIGYYVPHHMFPAGYHCDPREPLPFVGLASQKNHMAIYLMCVYSTPDQTRQLREEWAKAGKKLDMGKSCIRFKKLEDLPLDALGRIIAAMPVKRYVAEYLAAFPHSAIGRKKQ